MGSEMVLRVARIALIVILVLVLCWQGLVALCNFVESPVGSKESQQALPENSGYFPAVTVCPFVEPAVERAILVNPEYNFSQTLNERTAKFHVYHSFHNNPVMRISRNATVHKTYVHIALMYVQECQTFTFMPEDDWYPLVNNSAVQEEDQKT